METVYEEMRQFKCFSYKTSKTILSNFFPLIKIAKLNFRFPKSGVSGYNSLLTKI